MDATTEQFVLETPDPNGGEFDPHEPTTPFDIDQYDYESDTEDDETDEELRLINAQLQWEESLEQVQKLLGLVILPLVGKVLGRRFAGVVWRWAWDYFG